MAKAEVILASEPITDPQIRRPDILIALAEDAVKRHRQKVKPGGMLVTDSDLVGEVKAGDFQLLEIPATSLAEKEMGNVVVANLILLGGLIQKTKLLSVEAMEKAIEVSVPPKAKALNLKAFRRGLELVL
jgi:2-oxoglutarate ferredoxin oxidoreductase subunit gamma